MHATSGLKEGHLGRALAPGWISPPRSAYLVSPMSSPDSRKPNESAPQPLPIAKPKAPRPQGPPRKKRALPLEVVSKGMIARRVDVAPRDVVYLKGILEASEGLAALFAERGGELVITSPLDRAEELDVLLRDLAEELGATVEPRSLALEGST